MEVVQEWLPVIVGVVVFAVAAVGLALALRTEGGREALAAGAVRFALAMLALAERWLGRQMESGGAGRDARRDGEIRAARLGLTRWMDGR